MDTKRDLSPEEVQVNKVLDQTARDIAKLEVDIQNLQNRGKPQLVYNPPGMSSINPLQNKKEVEKLKSSIEIRKADAVNQTDKIVANLPEVKQNEIKQDVREKLKIQDEKKEPEPVEKKSFSSKFMNQEKSEKAQQDVSRFGQSLGHSKFLSNEPNQQKDIKLISDKDER